MSIREVMARNPVEVFAEVIFDDPVDQARRLAAKRRVDLYYDRSEQVLRQEMYRVFDKAPERRVRLEVFSFLATALSLFRRITNEVAKPVYNPPPVRLFDDPQAQAAWQRLAEHVELDRKMDIATRLGCACGSTFGMWRKSERLDVLLSVLTPDRVVVVADPEDPMRELGVAYRKDVRVTGGRWEQHWVCWDSEFAFQLNPRGSVEGVHLTKASGHPGILPFWAMHMVERTGSYWEASSAGAALEAGHSSIALILAHSLRLVQAQGHAQIGVTGDPGRFPRGQVLDPENPVFWGDGNQGSMLFNPQDPSGNLRVIESIITMVAANNGVDRERLNAQITAEATGLALLERRDEILQVADGAERQSIRCASLVSRSSKAEEMRMPEGAKLEELSWPDMSAKTDREKQLRVRAEETKQGQRSEIMSMLEDVPELDGDETKARERLLKIAGHRADFIELQKTLGIRTDANADEPGQTQEENGAMGPEVRDGKKTKDEAAEQAVVGRRGRVAQ